MKIIYFLIFTCCFINGIKAQIIHFPDANFKAKLLLSNDANFLMAQDEFNNFIKIDFNNDGEIDVNEASRVATLYVEGSSISSLDGISYFNNLSILGCSFNSLTSLDLSYLSKLKELYCSYNQLTSLDINHLVNLKTVLCRNNQIETLIIDNLSNLEILLLDNNKIKSLDVSKSEKILGIDCSYNEITTMETGSLNELDFLYCNGNQFTILDISKFPKLDAFTCSNNPELNSLFIKNGKKERYLDFSDNPNLKYICVDESQSLEVQDLVTQYNYSNVEINSYCSFSPGGTTYTINGNSTLDSNNNGCDVLDVTFPNMRFSVSDGIQTSTMVSDNTGNYSIKVQEGNYNITPIVENPVYFSITPSTLNVSFPNETSLFVQNFCVTPNGVHSDLEVIVLQTDPARPGFDVSYKIIYKNKGNNLQSGAINLNFDDPILDFVVSSPVVSTQATNNLSWNFTNLKPFESREISFTLNVNSPMEIPAVNNDDILKFVATIASQSTDETPIDNTFTLNQIVVGSFDPNDKTCLEGAVITPSLIGEYVHYMIRFENTGTYQAQNIVVKDLIDLSKFDISTLIPISSSHSFVTRISEGNKVEFIFENINLPFDDANNDGYVAFKIKTLPTLAVGDSFTNEANIYFDYNFPILTNKATSKFQTTLSNTDFEFSNYFTLYPNPVNDFLNINVNQVIEIQSLAIYDILGQLVIAVPNAKSVTAVDVSKLRTGKYLIEVKSNKGKSSSKFIKK